MFLLYLLGLLGGLLGFLSFVGFFGSYIFLDTIVAPFLSSSATSAALCFIAKHVPFFFFGFPFWVGSLFFFRLACYIGLGGVLHHLSTVLLFVLYGENNHSSASFSLRCQVYNPMQFGQVSIYAVRVVA